ncbi:MAG: hypothetical protein IJN50_05070 [Clostridia bacterium]|nr:hypothetical protein [Clostridia bacterium]
MINLTEEQKNNIISECINSRKTFKVIARENEIGVDDIYSIVNEYCQKNGYSSFRRTHNGTIFERIQYIESGFLKNLREIQEWNKENRRRPIRLGKVKVAKEGEKETAEQKERRLALALKTIKHMIVKQYDNISLNNIKNENHREIVRIVRELEQEWENIFQKEKSEANLNKARKLEEWCIENGKRPRKLDKVKFAKKGEKETKEQKEKRMSRIYSGLKKDIEKYEDKNLEEIEDENDREYVKIVRDIENRYERNVGNRRSLQDSEFLKNAINLKTWCIENRRRPRALSNVKIAKKGEKENEEQKEKRMSKVWWNLNNKIVKKYEGISLENIKDKVDKEIVRIIRELQEIYPKNKRGQSKLISNKNNKKRGKAHFVKTVGNEKMKKMIVNLIKTKNATEEQIKVIADFYGVDMGKVINEKDER